MDVYFPVFDGLPDIFDVEIIGKMTRVGLQSALNFITFLGCEKSCSVEELVAAMKLKRSRLTLRDSR